MKRFFLCAALCTLLFTWYSFTPADAGESATGIAAKSYASLLVSDLIIREEGSQVDFRVVVRNIGNADAENLEGNLTVVLFVLDTSTKKWQELKRWSDIDKIAAGEKVARDYLPLAAKNPQVLSGKFTLKAAIELKNGGDIKISKADMERSYPQKKTK